MFNPFDSPSADIFGRRPFSDAQDASRAAESSIIAGAAQNSAYVSAKQRARKYAKKQREKAKQQARDQSGGSGSFLAGIGGSVAAGAASAGVSALI